MRDSKSSSNKIYKKNLEVITAPKQDVVNDVTDTANSKTRVRKASSTSSQSGHLSFQESDNSEELLLESENIETYEEPQILEINKWVFVQFATKKIVKHFVGKIIEKLDSDEWLIKFLTSKKISSFGLTLKIFQWSRVQT